MPTPDEPHTPDDGYPVPSEYPSEEVPGTDEVADEVRAEEGGAGIGDAEQPWWDRLGFESFQAYLDEINRLNDLYMPSRPRGRPLTELPGEEEIGDIGEPYRPEPMSHQVNVKLHYNQRHELNAAARLFAIAPSTLARHLVNRGVRAILDREP